MRSIWIGGSLSQPIQLKTSAEFPFQVAQSYLLFSLVGFKRESITTGSIFSPLGLKQVEEKVPLFPPKAPKTPGEMRACPSASAVVPGHSPRQLLQRKLGSRDSGSE